MARYLPIAIIALLIISVSSYSQNKNQVVKLHDNLTVTIHQKDSEADSEEEPSLPFIEDFENNNFAENWEISRSLLLDSTRYPANVPKWFLCSPSSFYGSGQQYIHTGEQSVAISSNAPDFTWLVSNQTIQVSPGDSLEFWMYYLNNPSDSTITHLHVALIDTNGLVINTIGSWGAFESIADQKNSEAKDDSEGEAEGEDENGDAVEDPNDNGETDGDGSGDENGNEDEIDDEIDDGDGDEDEDGNGNGNDVDESNLLISPSNLYNSKVSIALGDYENQMVRIAFVHENRGNLNKGFNMAIDNISVGHSGIPKLSVKAKQLPFSKLPFQLTDTIEVSLGAYIQNTGADFSETSTLEVSIPALNHSQSIQINEPIPSGTKQLYTFPIKVEFTSINPRIFDLYYTISTENHNYITQEKDSLTLETTDSTFATDFGVKGGISLGQSTICGNVYPIEKPLVASSVSIGWHEFPNNNQSIPFGLRVYQVNPMDNSINILYSSTFTRIANQKDSTYKIDPIYLTPGFKYFFGVEQRGSQNLGIGMDKTANGSFWRVNPTDSTFISMLASSSIGNLAVRVSLAQPESEPKLNLNLTFQGEPVEDADIIIDGITEQFSSDSNGQVSIALPNGWYEYTIFKEPYLSIRSTVFINNASVSRDVDMQIASQVQFIVIEPLNYDGKSKGSMVEDEDSSDVGDGNGDDDESSGDEVNDNGEGNSEEDGDGEENGDDEGNDSGDGNTEEEEEEVEEIPGVRIENASIYINGAWHTTGQDGSVYIQLANSTYDYTVIAKGREPLRDRTVSIQSDTTHILEMGEDSLSYFIELTILGETSDSFLELDKVGVNLHGYGTKVTNTSGMVTFAGIAKDSTLKVSLNRYGYHSRTIELNLSSDTTLIDTLFQQRYDILFEVLSNNTPLSNASISIELENGAEGITNINGQAVLKNILPNASIPIKVVKSDFKVYTDTLSIVNSSIKQIVRLDSVPPPPEPPDPPEPPTTNSMGNEITSGSISVFPNPTSGVLTIKREGNFDVQIITLSGQVLLTKRDEFSTTSIDLSNQPSGIYLVRVISNNHSWVHRIIRQ